MKTPFDPDYIPTLAPMRDNAKAVRASRKVCNATGAGWGGGTLPNSGTPKRPTPSMMKLKVHEGEAYITPLGRIVTIGKIRGECAHCTFEDDGSAVDFDLAFFDRMKAWRRA